MKILIYIVAGLCGLVVAACATYVYMFYPRSIEPYEVNAPDVSPKVLIATHGSDFKNQLVSELCDTLEKQPAYVKVINVNELDRVDAANWQAVIVVNTVMWNKMNSRVRQFLSRPESRGNTLAVFTSGGNDYLPEPPSVNAITAASRKGNVDRLVTLVVDWTGKRSESGWIPDDYVLALEFFCGIDVEAGCEVIRTHKESYLDRYPRLEQKINRIGYNYIRRGDLKLALPIFRVNVDLFSDSWNVHDSYAETLLKNGDRDSARAAFRKAVDLNPDGEYPKRVEKVLGEKI